MAIDKKELDIMTIEDLKVRLVELDTKHDELVSNFEGVKEKITEKETEIKSLKSEKLDLILKIPVPDKTKEKEEEEEQEEKTYEDLIKEMNK